MVSIDKQTKSVKGKGQARRFLPPHAEAMQLTERDIQMVEAVYAAGMASTYHLYELFFTQGGLSRCHDRLGKLYGNRYLDKLPNRAVNSPDIYYVSRRATKGLKLLRSLHPDKNIKSYTPQRNKLEHSLDLIDCRFALAQACKSTGFKLSLWLGEEELTRRMQKFNLEPDAYFQIIRPTEVRDWKANFFLEVDRSAKSNKFLQERFAKYGSYFYQGQYTEQFDGATALRILYVIDSDYGHNTHRQIARYLAICRKLQVTIFRFATLEDLLGLEPKNLLTAQIWHHPKEAELCSLF